YKLSPTAFRRLLKIGGPPVYVFIQSLSACAESKMATRIEVHHIIPIRMWMRGRARPEKLSHRDRVKGRPSSRQSQRLRQNVGVGAYRYPVSCPGECGKAPHPVCPSMHFVRSFIDYHDERHPV